MLDKTHIIAAFLIKTVDEPQRTIKEVLGGLKEEEMFITLEFASSGNTSKIPNWKIQEKIMKKLKFIKFP